MSQAKHFVWGRISGLLGGCSALSASRLRNWVLTLATYARSRITVPRRDGESETITRLRDYQEESVAQRFKRGLIQGRMIYLDDYGGRPSAK